MGWVIYSAIKSAGEKKENKTSEWAASKLAGKQGTQQKQNTEPKDGMTDKSDERSADKMASKDD